MNPENSIGSHSVTMWLERLKSEDSLAAQKLWNLYLSKLIHFANKKLGSRELRLGDGEDVVVMAFENFLKCVREERFPKLDDRDDLWQVLMMLTDRKAKDHLAREFAKKRGANQLVGESAVSPVGHGDKHPSMDWMEMKGPTPEYSLEVAEEFQILISKLKDSDLQHIAVAKLEGYTNSEIAKQLGVSLRSVERRLSMIRNIWESEAEDG